jgi:hypothetical protein
MRQGFAIVLAGCAVVGTQGTQVAGPPKTPDGPALRLLEKHSAVIPGHHADGLVQEGKIEVETPEANRLVAKMTGAVAAHCFLGCTSQAIQTFRLEQEFEVEPAPGKSGPVRVVFDGTLKGYLRSNHKGQAAMRVARASVASVGGGAPVLELALTPGCVIGAGGAQEQDQHPDTPPEALLVPGRYVLRAEWTIEASASGIACARGVADFSPDSLPDSWKQDHDPFKDADRKAFGLQWSLEAKAPSMAVTLSPRVVTR